MVERVPEAVFASVPGGGVVLNTATKRYYSLNETGARIWVWLEESGDPGVAASRVVSEYAVAPREAEQAVTDLVTELTAAGLLRAVERQPPEVSGSLPPPA